MLSVWIEFGLEMRGLTMRVPALANVHVKTTTRPTFKLINLLFGKLGAKGSNQKATSNAGNDFVKVNLCPNVLFFF